MKRWLIRLENRASKEIEAFPSSDRLRILRFLNDRLATRANPRELGEALTGPLAGLWKYRVGNFRLFARIDDRAGAIDVARVGDRRAIYRR